MRRKGFEKEHASSIDDPSDNSDFNVCRNVDPEVDDKVTDVEISVCTAAEDSSSSLDRTCSGKKIKKEECVENVGIADLQSSVEGNAAAAASSAPLKISHESQSSSQAEVEENKGDDEEEESEGTGENKSKPFYKVPQKVFARDTSTGLLCAAIIRKIQYGPKSRQVNVHLLP